MLELFADLLRITIGVTAGVLGMYFAVITWRAFNFGSEAYAANRAAVPSSFRDAFAGIPRHLVDTNNRNNHGLAVEIKSGKIVPQQKLSKEAVADVIGRRA